MSILSFISGIFKPASDLIDNLHVSDEERGKLKNELAKIQAKMQEKSVELMRSEVSSDHFIVAAWRPMCMLSLILLIVLDGFGALDAPQQVYGLFEVLGSAYVGGRSLEKVARAVKGK